MASGNMLKQIHSKSAHVMNQYQSQTSSPTILSAMSTTNSMPSPSSQQQLSSGQNMSLRDYQQVLSEQAVKNNLLVLLPTGSGKTLIGVELIRKLMGSPYAQGKRAVFLGPTRELVSQQCKVCEKYLQPYRVKKFIGSMMVDAWDINRWQQEKMCVDVMVMTPQVLVDCLKHAFMDMSEILVIVLDEVHNARGNSPYSQLLKEYYQKQDEQNRPRILGLSASPVGSRNNILKSIQELIEVTGCQLAEIPVSACKFGTNAETRAAQFRLYEIDEFVSEFYEKALEKIEGLRATVKQFIAQTCKGSSAEDVNWKVETKMCSSIVVAKKHVTSVQHCLQQLGPLGALIFCLDALRHKNDTTGIQNFYQALQRNKEGRGEVVDTSEDPETEYRMQGVSPEQVKQCLKETYVTLVNAVIAALHIADRQYYEFQDDELAREDYLKVRLNLADFIERTMQQVGLSLEIVKSFSTKELVEDLYSDEIQQTSTHLSLATSQQFQQLLQSTTYSCHKYDTLVKILLHQTGDLSSQQLQDWRGLIFVQQRCTVSALKKILEIDGRLQHLRICFLTGDNQGITQAMNQSLQRFRSGEYNVMVATSVVEEGIDVLQCKLVIRYDLPPTVKAYIQSKGRARAHASLYILMHGQGNLEHDSIMAKCKTGEAKLKETLTTGLCSEDSEASNMDVDNDQMDIEMESESSDELINFEKEPEQIYAVESTNARIGESQALQLLHQYCDSLPHDQYTSMAPQYMFQKGYAKLRGVVGSELQVYRYKIKMPGKSRIAQLIVGPYDPNRKVAKQKAAIRVIKELHRIRELDDNLVPINQSQRSVLNREQLQLLLPNDEEQDEFFLDKCGIRLYQGLAEIKLIQIPNCFLWPQEKPDWGVQPRVELNVYSLPTQVWGLATVQQLPILDNNKAYHFCGTMELNAQQLSAMMSFHLLLVDILSFKAKKWCGGANYDDFFCEQTQHIRVLLGVDSVEQQNLYMSSGWYLLFPYIQNWDSTQLKVVQTQPHLTDIPQKALQFQKFMRQCSQSTLEDRECLVNKNNIQQGCVVYHVYNHDIFQYLKWSDRKLNFTFSKKRNGVERQVTYWEHFQSSYPRELQRYKIDDYLIEAYTGAPKRRTNFQDESHFYYMLPSILRVHPMHKDLWLSTKGLLDHLWSLQNMLVINDASQQVKQMVTSMYQNDKGKVGLTIKNMDLKIPDLPLMQEMFTSKSASSEQNYETLETLGDSVLKLLISIHLYRQYLSAHEGILSTLRCKVVSNNTLFKCIRKTTLCQYLRLQTRHEYDWGPSGKQYLQQLTSQKITKRKSPDQLASPNSCKRVNSRNEYDESTDNSLVIPLVESSTQLQFGNRGGGIFAEYFSLEGCSNCNVDIDMQQNPDYNNVQAMDKYAVQRTSTKVPADFLEAMIGAFYKVNGLRETMGFVQGLDLLSVLEDDVGGMELDRNGVSATNSIDAYYQKDWAQVEQLIGYQFSNRNLLKRAFTHSACATQGVECYERLEYLGDAVLDYMVISQLHEKYPEYGPCELSDIRMFYCSNTYLGYRCVALKLQNFIIQNSVALVDDIARFVNHVESGMQVDDLYAEDQFQTPKVLGDIIESIIGAVCVETCGNFEVISKVIERLCGRIPTIKEVPKNPISQFYQQMQQCQREIDIKPVDMENQTWGLYLDGKLFDTIRCQNKHQAKQQLCSRAINHFQQIANEEEGRLCT